jgi:ATP-dependent protease ClpP protease subunit
MKYDLNKKYLNNLVINKRNSDEDDEGFPAFAQQQHLPFFENTQTSTCIKAYLDETIKEAKYYRNWISSVESLSENDMVYLSVNSYGGYLDGAIAIINAMKSTEASVHVCLDGVAASAASLIALASPSVSVSPYASMMIHAATFGAFGKQSDVISHASFIDKQVKVLMNEIYKDFLTEKEFEEVIVGREIWFDAEEIIKRLQARAEIQQKRKDEEDALEAEKEQAVEELLNALEGALESKEQEVKAKPKRVKK